MIKKICIKLFQIITQWDKEQRIALINKKYNFINVSLSSDIIISGNISIGEGTYINNNARIVSGENSKVTIGDNCAIGRFLSCAARTHNMISPTKTIHYKQNLRTESDIQIGNHVWIGDHVTIKEGITIGNFAIIGANSVVTKNVKDFEIVGGIPAKHIRYNTEHYLHDN